MFMTQVHDIEAIYPRHKLSYTGLHKASTLQIHSILQYNRKPQLAGDTPRVVVITSGKGGVGKTTTTANIGLSLARLGFSVVAIDCDVGLRNLDLLLGLEGRVNYTRCRDQIADWLWWGKHWFDMDALKARDEGVPDFILIDCPADAGFITAITPANEAVLVTAPDVYQLTGRR
ncbi:putative septum site-determining protein minD chloroplastic [Datura stramonium]|uniref:Septum site-determining protein minD chloroplastic n=1 Tax=Datura stramonium TaxID=4076 RepID=A0ABS8S624_DATST|nr:putative septum site-determining protein minD chloroplastic [Datura stramonium]